MHVSERSLSAARVPALSPAGGLRFYGPLCNPGAARRVVLKRPTPAEVAARAGVSKPNVSQLASGEHAVATRPPATW
ncbi:hypothetical protein GCM10010405_22950 [Streptomyces macrosporus]|uniref:Uncharacterized protein n=1 Tax=Streptomyces macrosporus TaxID=44032 RepID=A0ABN3JTK1_9ACTN